MQMPDSNSQWASLRLTSGEPMTVAIECRDRIDAHFSLFGGHSPFFCCLTYTKDNGSFDFQNRSHKLWLRTASLIGIYE